MRKIDRELLLVTAKGVRMILCVFGSDDEATDAACQLGYAIEQRELADLQEAAKEIEDLEERKEMGRRWREDAANREQIAENKKRRERRRGS